MSEFKIIVLTQEPGRTITEQFNFWMATTFAVVIASYTAGERLCKAIRVYIAALYLAAVSVFKQMGQMCCQVKRVFCSSFSYYAACR